MRRDTLHLEGVVLQHEVDVTIMEPFLASEDPLLDVPLLEMFL